MTLIATQQPMAGDMRLLAAILEIVTELERMGDYAKGIARINLMIGEQPLIKPLIDLPVMAHKARDMLHAALVAFVERDVQAARAIPQGDDEVDALYNQVYRELICLHPGRPAGHRAGQPPDVGRPQPGTHRRPGDQPLRASGLCRHRRVDRAGTRTTAASRAWREVL